MLFHMATHDSKTPLPLRSAPITSIQPGGGFCFALERAWGRIRRALLRPFRRPRQFPDRCANCPHDIVDSRDLKLVRNVCCIHLPTDQDPLRRRSTLPLARAGRAELLFFSLILLVPAILCAWFAIESQPLLWIPTGILGALWLFVLSFFRDPERIIPSDPDALLSPADGTITHVEEVADTDFPGGRAFRISIFLSVFNVHVNRVPRAGQALGIRYFPGRFLDARSGECAVVNEQLWLDIGEGPPGRLVRVKQISGAIARRIVCWLKPGEELAAGERFGMIKFGSRTDVLVPADAVKGVTVKVGDSVRGGSTILLRLKNG
jgi:phosphatidylserine decarboxylase